MNRPRGFTLVELVVVVAVMAILLTLATLGLTRYQADGRDTRRSASVTVISEALEKYYDSKGEYPSCQAITAAGPTVTTTVLKGVDQASLLVPGAKSPETNSIKCGTPLALSGNDFIQYVGDGSADCTGSGSCLSFKLRYREESKNRIAELSSRRTVNIATSGTIKDLAATPNGFTAINLSWGAVSNTVNYTLQRATDEAFTTGLVTQSVSATTYSVSSLVPGTTYYFRVMPIGASQTGAWSNIASNAPLELGEPILSTTVNSTTQITASWTTAENANSATRYTLVRATNSAFTTDVVTVPNINATNHVSTGLVVGQSYFFRVQAVTTGDTSGWSNTASSSTIPAAPTGVTATVNSATQITIAWTAAAGATGYTVKYGTASGANTYTASTTGTSLAITANITQGTTFYFRVHSTSGGIEGTASTQVSGTTPINAPGAYNMNSSSDGASLTGTSPVSCPAGTSPDYYWNANGGLWVRGTQYRSVTYSLSPGQGITIQVATRCYKDSIYSDYTWSSNAAGYTRPGMNLSLSLADDGCPSGFCGRNVRANWNNMCGTGAPRIYAKQLSAYANWVADASNTDLHRWKGASGSGVLTEYYDINIGCASTAGSIRVISAYKCTGCS